MLRRLGRVYEDAEATIDPYKVLTCLNVELAYFFDGDTPDRATTNDLTAQRDATKNELFDRIESTDGCILALGTTRKSEEKKRGNEQKEVDVRIAVEAMLLASRGAMKHAVILTSDLDFRPLVNGLLQLGVYVTLIGGEQSPSPLRRSAASFKVLSEDWLYHIGFNKPDLYPFVRGGGLHGDTFDSLPDDVIRGTWGDGLPVVLYDLNWQWRSSNGPQWHARTSIEASPRWGHVCGDRDVLKRYCQIFHGVTWEQSKDE